ncbi:MAG TPA: nuclear transport factor 2 family protein [Acidimicrobiia bacterium]|nr:nuclear transport factor 2 family protein [Acidimicrobiia bacterium]
MGELAPLERLIAHDAIRQLVARYAVALDARDVAAVAALFVEDVRVGRDGRGRVALADYLRAAVADLGVTILSVGTQLIDVADAAHATGVVYCRGELQVGDRWVVQAIQYRDTYACREGQWLFVRREHLLWYGRDLPTSPAELAPANWPQNHTGWGEPDRWSPWAPRAGDAR